MPRKLNVLTSSALEPIHDRIQTGHILLKQIATSRQVPVPECFDDLSVTFSRGFQDLRLSHNP